jgi:hypothetical protein
VIREHARSELLNFKSQPLKDPSRHGSEQLELVAPKKALAAPKKKVLGRMDRENPQLLTHF